MAAGEKPKFFATGNRATGFIAFGNIATGVIAVGNVTRGFIAIGNVAIGVIAIGNVGFGVIGIGASVAGGFVAYGAASAFPIVMGTSASGVDEAFGPFAGLIASAMFLLISYALRGKLPAPPEEPPFVSLAELRARRFHEGWVRARFGGRDGSRVRLRIEGGEQLLEMEGTAERLVAADPPAEGTELFARLKAQEEPAADQRGGYREGAGREVVLRCDALREPPPRLPIWADKDHLLYYLAFGWRGAGVVGLAWTLFLFASKLF